MEDQEQKSGSRWVPYLLLGCVAAGIVAAAVVVIPMVMPQQSTELVIIKATDQSFKVKPVDAGGQKIKNQNSAVMDMLGDLNPTQDDVENLIPPTAAPELPATALTPDPVTETEAAPAPAAETAAVEETPEAVIVAKPKPVAEVVKQDKTEQPAATAEQAAPKKKPIVIDGDEPLYMVQLAAFRKPDIAAEQAGLLGSKHQSRLQGSELATMRIDAGDNGVFWRIVSEPLPRAAADGVCASLKRAGQDCILRKFVSPAQ